VRAEAPASAASPITGAASSVSASAGDLATSVEPMRSSAVVWWVYPLAAVLVLIILAMLLKAGRREPRRLLPLERQETLAQLKQWIESPEVER
jgi:cytochrome c-type biogenesis protein CcmH/NrfF